MVQCAFHYDLYEPCINEVQPNTNFCHIHENATLDKHREKQYACRTIQYYLAKCSDTSGRMNRAIICRQLFDFLVERPYFMNFIDASSKRFKATVYDKLCEFEETCTPDEIDIEYYKNRLFPKTDNYDIVELTDIVIEI